MAKKEQSFEEKMTTLNELLAQLQSPETSLEDSIKIYETSAKLIADCKEILDKSELKIEEITASIELNESN